MNKHYQEVAENLYRNVDEAIELLRKQFTSEGLGLGNVFKQTMAVEVVALVLTRYLAEERLAIYTFENELWLREQALKTVKMAVMQYRSENSPTQH